MKEEFRFIILASISFLSWCAGTGMISGSITNFFQNTFASIFSIIGGVLCLFSICLLIFIYRRPLIVEVDKNRSIDSEKKILVFLFRYSYILSLFGVTFLIFAFAYYFSKILPVFQLFLIAIASGAVGGFWGVGMRDVGNFSQWCKYGKCFEEKYDWSKKTNRDWYSPKTFLINLLIWKKRFIYSLLFFTIMTSIVCVLLYKNII